MQSDEAESKKQIEEAFLKAGLEVPALKDVLASLKLDRARAQQIVTLLLRDRTLIKVNEELVFHHQALDALKAKLLEMKKTSPEDRHLPLQGHDRRNPQVRHPPARVLRPRARHPPGWK